MTFAASHRLSKFPADHKCYRLHGHNYRVDLEFESGYLDEAHVVIDFGLVSGLLKQEFDHKNLNDIAALHDNPTAELLAQYIYDLLDHRLLFPLNREAKKDDEKIKTTRVRVWENDSCWAEYRPKG